MNDQIDEPQKRVWTHRADNRERLIAAGYKILSEKGVEATTVKEIARLADVSPGLFHYYFASKNELLLAVLYEAGRRFNGRLETSIEGMTPEAFPALAIRKAHEIGDPAWYRLRYELYALGLRNPEFLPAVGEFLATIRRVMSGTISQMLGVEWEQAHAIAAVLLAITDGLALQHFAQPDLDQRPAYAVVQSMLDAQRSLHGHEPAEESAQG